MTNDLMLLGYVPNLRDLFPPVVKPDGTVIENKVFRLGFGREMRFPYFLQGYVSLDIGRDTEVTTAIQQNRQGFALANAQGQVLATYKDLKNAEQARRNAVPRVMTELELEPETADSAVD